MNFLTMEYFLMLAQEKNFTRAAERLHITQQTLSAHIALLEKETQSKLFVRHVPLELTYTGKIFWRYAQEFQKKQRSLKQELNDAVQQEAGELRIGTTPTREEIILPRLIGEFHQRHPHIIFRLTEAPNAVLQQKLLEGEIDLALAYFPTELAGIEQRPYYKEEVVLLAAHTLLRELYGEQLPTVLSAIEQEREDCLTVLHACPFVLNGSSTIAGTIARQLFAQANIRPRVTVVSDNMETLLHLCVAGVGAMFCPLNLAKTILAKAEIATLQIMTLPSAKYQIAFGLRKEPHRWSILEQFVEECCHKNN
ncbi:MAG: LysR family transcriptional regulator [Acidaminococcaceae bacterium]|nr:LysR family transcriptional regulator [Acidaminococcaceae bacterium]